MTATQTTFSAVEEETPETPETPGMPPPTGQPCRRIPLGSGAELIVPHDAYERYRERIDWLVRWARKVFE